MTISTSTISDNGQTTIPVEVRRFLKLEPGHKILYRHEGDHVVMEPATATAASLYGSLKYDGKRPTEAQIHGARVEYAKKKYVR